LLQSNTAILSFLGRQQIYMINENIVLFTVNLDPWLVKLIEIVNLKLIQISLIMFLLNI